MASQDISRLSRLISILTQLQTKRIVSATELSNKFDVTIRTIYRDIRALEDADVPIVTIEGKGYSILDGYRMPPLLFTEQEVNALITAEQLVLKNKDSSFVKDYSSAISKVKAILKLDSKDKAQILSNKIVFRQNSSDASESQYLSELQLALTNTYVVQINYLSEDEQLTLRKIEAFAIYNTQNNWLLIAWCRLRKDFRVFRLDRMQSLNVLLEKYKPQKMTLEEYFEICRAKYFSKP